MQSVELLDGAFAEVHASLATKVKEQGEELTGLMKNLQQLANMVRSGVPIYVFQFLTVFKLISR